MKKRILPRLGLAVVLTVGAGQIAIADESLGRLEVSGLFLRPTYVHREPKAGQFSAGSSYAELRWTLGSAISAQLKFGTQDLLGRPARFGPQTEPERVAMVEAYAQADDPAHGRFRLGLLPVAFGLEGGDTEQERQFPRSLLYQERYLVLRDYGASYHISSAGFFSDLTAHNGEGGVDLDHELWFSARLGWRQRRDLVLGFSGSAGRTSVLSTNPNGSFSGNGAWLDINQPARLRIVNFFVSWLLHPVRLEVEGTGGEAVQGESVIKTRALHADLEYITGGSVNGLMRYDVLDPRNDQGSDQLTEYSLGLAWRSQYGNSILTLLGTKRVQQDVPVDEHRAMVMWRIAPLAELN